MCIGRSMNFEPSRSARARSAGPRSTVNDRDEQRARRSPRRPPRIASAHRRLTRPAPAQRDPGCRRLRLDGASAATPMARRVIGHRTAVHLLDDDQDAAGFDRRALGDAHVLDAARLGERSSFSIFIASTTTTGWRGRDLVAGADEHADDPARHRRHHRLRRRRRAAGVVAARRRAPAVHGDDGGIRPSSHDQALARRRRRHDRALRG